MVMLAASRGDEKGLKKVMDALGIEKEKKG